jgi:GntR family transcriptional regulator
MPKATVSLPIKIDKSIPVPIYHQIQEEIKQLIKTGEVSPHDRIPSENELAKQFDISPMTARQALTGLAINGYVYRMRGLGTYIAPPHMEHSLDKLVSFSEDMRARGIDPSSHIILFQMKPASEKIAERLKISPGDEVLRIKRLRFADQRPVCVHDAYLLRNLPVTRAELEEVGSLYQVLESKNIHISGGLDEIESISSDQELSELLGVDVGSPMVQLTRLTEGLSGDPIELVIAAYRADFYRYTIRLKR